MGAIYLFLGSEAGLKNDEIASIRSSMEKKHGNLEFKTMYASDSSISEILDILESGSLFESVSLLVLREAESVKKKDDILLLEEFSKNESENVLILSSDEWKVDSKLDKIVNPKNKKTFQELFANRKEAWLRDFFKREGLEIESDAISLILELVENDTESLRTECSRFKWCFPSGATIKTGDVEKVLAHNREENAFTLFNAISKPDDEPKVRLENALSILQKISLTKNSSPVLLIAGLSSCFRKLSLWHELQSSGQNDDFSLKKNGFVGKTICNQYSRAARIWGSGQSAAVSALLSECDMEMRSIGNSLNNVQLSLLLYEIIVKNGMPIASYS